MSTDEYVPSEEDVREAYALEGARDTIGDLDYGEVAEGRAEFDRFLARVRRDAEAELDSWMTRAYEAEKRAWQAEARIKAVQDVLDTWMTYCQTEQTARALSDIRRALEG